MNCHTDTAVQSSKAGNRVSCSLQEAEMPVVSMSLFCPQDAGSMCVRHTALQLVPAGKTLCLLTKVVLKLWRTVTLQSAAGCVLWQNFVFFSSCRHIKDVERRRDKRHYSQMFLYFLKLSFGFTHNSLRLSLHRTWLSLHKKCAQGTTKLECFLCLHLLRCQDVAAQHLS